MIISNRTRILAAVFAAAIVGSQAAIAQRGGGGSERSFGGGRQVGRSSFSSHPSASFDRGASHSQDYSRSGFGQSSIHRSSFADTFSRSRGSYSESRHGTSSGGSGRGEAYSRSSRGSSSESPFRRIAGGSASRGDSRNYNHGRGGYDHGSPFERHPRYGWFPHVAIFADFVPLDPFGCRIGFVPYDPFYQPIWFFGGYCSWPSRPCVTSPWYYYPELPPFVEQSVAISDSEPRYASDYEPYSWSAQSSEPLDRTIQDITLAYGQGSPELIEGLTPSKGNVAIYLDGAYKYSVSGRDFGAMLHDSVSTVHTDGYRALSARKYHDGTVLFEAEHNTTDPKGEHQTVYQSFRLAPEGKGYVIREFGTSQSKLY